MKNWETDVLNLLSLNKFQEADLYLSKLDPNQFDDLNKIIFFQLKLKSKQDLDSDENLLDIKYRLACSYFNVGQFQKALDLFNKIKDKKKDLKIYYSTWKSLVALGELNASLSAANKLLDHILNTKNVSASDKICSEIKSIYSGNNGIIKKLLIVDFLKGIVDWDFTEFGKEYDDLIDANVISFINNSYFKNNFWKVNSRFTTYVVESYLKNINFSGERGDRKKVVRLMYDLALQFGISESLVNVLLDYAIQSSHKELALYLLENYSDFLKEKKIVQSTVNKIKHQDRPEIDDGFDLGEDLFESETVIVDEKKIIEKMLFEIDILIKSNDFDAAKKLYEKILNYNPNTSLIKKIENKIQLALSKDLNTNPEVQSEELEIDIGHRNRTIIVKKIKNIGQDKVDRSFKDLMSMAFFIEDMTLAKQVLDLYSKGEAEKNIALIKYYELAIEFNKSNYESALNIIDEILTTIPLMDKDLICFVYFRGEIFYKKKNYSRALDCFRQVYQIDNGYRLVLNRIRSIENSI